MDKFIKLRKLMEKACVDALLITKEINVTYLTGFLGQSSWLVVTGTKVFFITNSIYITQAKEEVKGCTLVEATQYIQSVVNVLKQEKVTSVGFEPSQMLYKEYEEFNKALKGITFGPVQGAVEEIRKYKSEEEAAIIKKAVEISEFALYKTMNFIYEGISEKDLAIELEYRMKKGGADGIAFPTIVASGFRGALPHGSASAKPIKKGELIVIDFGCVYKGYCSDLTRTVGLGIIPPRLKSAYKVVYEAQQSAIKDIKSGAKLALIDKKARNTLKTKNLDKYFTHSTGHGIGMEVHEAPRLSMKSKECAGPGMVFTIEPGVYFPGEYGIRIENIAVVTENGCEILGKDQKQLVII